MVRAIGWFSRSGPAPDEAKAVTPLLNNGWTDTGSNQEISIPDLTEDDFVKVATRTPSPEREITEIGEFNGSFVSEEKITASKSISFERLVFSGNAGEQDLKKSAGLEKNNVEVADSAHKVEVVKKFNKAGKYSEKNFFFKPISELPLMARLESFCAELQRFFIPESVSNSKIVKNKNGETVGVLVTGIPGFTDCTKASISEKMYDADSEIDPKKKAQIIELLYKLARILVQAWIWKDDDVHRRNIDPFHAFRIDFDNTLWDLLRLVKGDRPDEIRMGRSLSDAFSEAFKITVEDIKTFPILHDSKLYYWLTQSNNILGLLDQSTFTENAYTPEEVDAFKSFANNTYFKEAQYEMMLEIILTEGSDIYYDFASMHLNEDDLIGAENKPAKDTVVANVHRRITELKDVSLLSPDFVNYAKNNFDAACGRIKGRFIETSQHNRSRRYRESLEGLLGAFEQRARSFKADLYGKSVSVINPLGETLFVEGASAITPLGETIFGTSEIGSLNAIRFGM